MKIAVSMPGKTGDAIYALPTIRYLFQKYNCAIDFYTSSHVERARTLFEYQSCIDKFIVPKAYKIERYDMGIQPIEMPLEDEYDQVYHLGYRYVPDCRLDHFVAKQVGIDPILLPRVYYDYPEIDFNLPNKFYLLAGSGESGYRNTFVDFAKISDLPVVQIGLGSHYLPEISDITLSRMDLDLLETVSLMSKCSGFVGLQTNQYVLANGFNFPKVAPHDGKSWDMRHVIYSDTNFYPVNPTGEEILTCLQLAQ